MQPLRTVAALLAVALPLRAQGTMIESPGMPPGSALGQTDRFSNEFNPALGFVVDALASYFDSDAPGEDGFDLELRTLELTAAAYVDPRAWAYAVLVGEPEEGVEVEEAAVRYLGLSGNHTLQAGRFFVDFGKQMQAHVHDLRTVDRPAVLREYLGAELAGTGLQYDNWFPAGDVTLVRYSLGVFQSLLAGGHEHGEEEEELVEALNEGRKDAGDLSWTGRLTALRDVGDRGTLQLGASARWVPAFTYEAEGLEEVPDNESWVWGADLTYGWKDETARRSWALGGEYLILDGDIRAGVDDPLSPTEILVEDDSASGFYLFADHGWTPNDHAGVQWSRVELPEEADAELSEYDVYYTRYLTEFQRLRFAVTAADIDAGDDEVRFTIQYTNYIGPHAHGINW